MAPHPQSEIATKLLLCQLSQGLASRPRVGGGHRGRSWQKPSCCCQPLQPPPLPGLRLTRSRAHRLGEGALGPCGHWWQRGPSKVGIESYILAAPSVWDCGIGALRGWGQRWPCRGAAERVPCRKRLSRGQRPDLHGHNRVLRVDGQSSQTGGVRWRGRQSRSAAD